MFRSLYSKMLGWLLLNLLILGLVGCGFAGFMIFGGEQGLMPASLFSSDIENVFRVLSTNLQYQHTSEWDETVKSYNKPNGLKFHLVSLDEPWVYFSGGFLPHDVLNAAQTIPKTPFTLCPDPTKVFKGTAEYQTETGLAPTPPAIFMRRGSPASYWYGRTLFVPDSQHKAHYLLLAAQSNTLSGNGLFFDFKTAALIILGIIGISCLWWFPFIWHIANPMLKMMDFAEKVASDHFDPESTAPTPSASTRKDEIGRLDKALKTMTKKLSQQMAGQRQFIRHIAHELNSPLARCKLGLAVLEGKSEGEYKQRVSRALRELEDLTQLTDDVLDFLRAQSSPLPAACEEVQLFPLLNDLASAYADKANIEMLIPPELTVWGDKNCIRRAVINALRNAVTYAGNKGPITVQAAWNEDELAVLLTVRDCGNGVPESELPSLLEPFFRGSDAQQAHPGGSGLGLSIIKSSLEQCGGQVRCANEIPCGFSVTMIFPQRT